MKVTIVGCSGSYGGPGNPCSCYLIEHDGYRVVIDFGSGALGELQRYGSLYDIDAVLLSHLHPDHCVDLCGYYVARKYRPAPEGPPRPVDVWGPAGTRERIAQAYGTDPLECEAAFTFRDLMEGADKTAATNTLQLGPLTATVALVNHPVEAYAIRLDTVDGKSFVYSGDTAPCAALDRLASGADLYFAEAAFQEPRDNELLGVHMNGREAGESATSAGVGQLVLTHIPPWTDSDANLNAAHLSYTDGPVALAQPGAVYTI